MPGLGSRGFRRMRSRQPSMEITVAEAARGSSSPSQVPTSPAQHRGSTNTEVEERCPICLDSWREPSFVMPCLHCFCYGCIQRWAHTKAQCPLCKGDMISILHSVRADDDFEEDFIIPPETPPEVPPEGSAQGDPDAPNPPRPGAHQQWGTEGDDQHFLGGFHLPNWLSCFSPSSALHQTLHSWFCQSLEMLFETVTSRVQYRRAPEQQRVPEQQRRREHRHRPCQGDTHGTTGQEDSSSSHTPAPARPSVDEMPSTSSGATGWGPSAHPSASTTARVEQERREERERLRAGLPNFLRGRDPSHRGLQRPRKRRASSPKGFPPFRRPRY